jgi:filamentous hemagglutinin family protein
MNARCFKTVFSEHLGCLVAVGEHACSQGKSSGESPPDAAVTAGSAVAVFIGAVVLSMAWVSLALASPVANALPTGGQVVQGAASMVQSANQLNITQASQRAAINWQSFDIGAAAKVNVVQPNAQAVLLNRVVGQSPSQIFGQLQANGHVILVNPNGVLFGKDGSVNAAPFSFFNVFGDSPPLVIFAPTVISLVHLQLSLVHL